MNNYTFVRELYNSQKISYTDIMKYHLIGKQADSTLVRQNYIDFFQQLNDVKTVLYFKQNNCVDLACAKISEPKYNDKFVDFEIEFTNDTDKTLAIDSLDIAMYFLHDEMVSIYHFLPDYNYVMPKSKRIFVIGLNAYNIPEMANKYSVMDIIIRDSIQFKLYSFTVKEKVEE